MSTARNMARLLRGDGIEGAMGDFLGLVNAGASIVIGIGAGLAWHSVGVGFTAVALTFFALFALLAHRTGQRAAAGIAVLGTATGAGAIGWFFGGPLGALLLALIAGGPAAACYVSIIQSLEKLPDDWY